MSAPRSQVSRMTENEWTVMVFFAGDPRLSPSMTAQLKGLKDAGFQEDTTVLVHYDPNEVRVNTTIFDINQARKNWLREQGKPATVIGDGTDPFVRNLLEDRIEGAPSKTANATEALKNFLTQGLATKAKHYLVFLVGHGVIVGNDFFLPDHNPEETGIKLTKLGELLRNFQTGAETNGGQVELIGLHSCSMSAIEVAYELQGAAKYMLATEGSSFVTSWPYRQIMKKILNAVDSKGKNVVVDDLVKSIQQLSLHNSKDFMFSGLSADVCLCSLERDKVGSLTVPVQNLTTALKAGLQNNTARELIKLAHLEAQSYFDENYTDLYDFCLCLQRKCVSPDPIQTAMRETCKAVRDTLTEKDGNVIVQADFFGPVLQYSHGLSIFFPWAEPMEAAMLGRYGDYQFTKALKGDSKDQDHSWLSFLVEYFSKTKRSSRQQEDAEQNRANGTSIVNNTTVAIDSAAGNGSNGADVLAVMDKPISSLDKPISSLDKPISSLEGGGCGCNIKNYPMEFSIASERAGHKYSPQEPSTDQRRERRAPAPR